MKTFELIMPKEWWMPHPTAHSHSRAAVALREWTLGFWLWSKGYLYAQQEADGSAKSNWIFTIQLPRDDYEPL